MYYLLEFVTDCTLIMLYYSFVYSRVNYGITIWGTINQNKLREVETKMNDIVRTITWHK